MLLIQVMCKVILFMDLMKEASFIFDIHCSKPEVFCIFFEKNQFWIAVLESNKLSPGTKHIANKYHHLQNFVQRRLFRYVIMIQFPPPLILLTKHYSYIYKENYPDADLKKRNFCFDKTYYWNTNIDPNSQLIRLKWQFLPQNNS